MPVELNATKTEASNSDSPFTLSHQMTSATTALNKNNNTTSGSGSINSTGTENNDQSLNSPKDLSPSAMSDKSNISTDSNLSILVDSLDTNRSSSPNNKRKESPVQLQYDHIKKNERFTHFSDNLISSYSPGSKMQISSNSTYMGYPMKSNLSPLSPYTSTHSRRMSGGDIKNSTGREGGRGGQLSPTKSSRKMKSNSNGPQSPSSSFSNENASGQESDTSARRLAHVASEQKRRQNINDGFEDLRRIVPTCQNTVDSKASILRKSAIYIKSLQSELFKIKGTTSQSPSFQNGKKLLYSWNGKSPSSSDSMPQQLFNNNPLMRSWDANGNNDSLTDSSFFNNKHSQEKFNSASPENSFDIRQKRLSPSHINPFIHKISPSIKKDFIKNDLITALSLLSQS